MHSRLSLVILFIGFMNVGGASKDTLVVGYNVVPPFVFEENAQPYGPAIWLWEQIADRMSLDYIYQRTSLDSLLYGLESGKIDIVSSPLTITASRAESFEFTSPFYVTHSILAIHEENAWQKAWLFIQSFFSINFFRALGALAIVILIFGFLEWWFERKHNPEEFGDGLSGLWHGFWWSAVTMTTVGYGDKSPKTVGGRIVALIWMFTAIIIISGFTASIASSLTIRQVSATQNSLKDFKERPVGTIEESGTDEWLKSHFFSNRVYCNDLPSCLVALNDEQVDAIAYDEPLLRELIKNNQGNRIELVDYTFNPQHYAFGMSSDIPDSLQRRLNIALLKKIESQDWNVVLSEFHLQ